MRFCLRVLSFVVALSANGCGQDNQTDESYETADVGASFDYKHIYFMEQDSVVRGYCPADAIVISRTTCALKHRVLASAFFDVSEKAYLDQIEKTETELNQYIALIADLDLKILMLLDSEADYNRSLLPSIRQKESLLIDVEIRITGIKDQISRIESELLAGEDSDLRALLHDQLGKLELSLEEKSEIRKSLADLRRQHLDLNNGILTTDTFRRLISQREQAVNSWNFAESALAFDLNRFGGYLAAVKFLKDGALWNFGWQDPVDDMTTRAVGEFGRVFTNLHAAQIFSEWDGTAMTFLVGRVGVKMWDVSYTNNNTGRNCTGVKIEHKNFTVIHNDNHLYVDRNRSTNYPHLAPLFSQIVSGQLRFTPICTGSFSLDDVTGTIFVAD
jgi:hypothetical protein